MIVFIQKKVFSLQEGMCIVYNIKIIYSSVNCGENSKLSENKRV